MEAVLPLEAGSNMPVEPPLSRTIFTASLLFCARLAGGLVRVRSQRHGPIRPLPTKV